MCIRDRYAASNIARVTSRGLLSQSTDNDSEDHDTGDAWRAVVPPEVSYVWLGVENAMAGVFGGDKDAALLADAVKAAMAGSAARDVLPRCHSMLVTGAHGVLTRADETAEPILSSLLRWCRQEMETMGLTFHLVDPSPHVVRKMWTGLCGKIWATLESSLNETDVGEEGRDQVIITALLRNADLFTEFISDVFKAALLLQHCSITRGLSDGW